MFSGQSLRVGEPAPLCYGFTADGQFWSFMSQAGRPVMILAMHGFEPPEIGGLICALSEISAAAGAYDADILLLCACPPDMGRLLAQALPPGLTVITTEERLLNELGVVPGQPVLFLLDRNMRVVGLYENADATILIDLGRLPRETPAPVLLIPNLLDRDLCTALISSFTRGHPFDSGVGGVNASAKFNSDKKRRRDILIDPAHALFARVAETVLKRSRPEIQKCFQIEVNHLDRILVGRYDVDNGHFRRHRDNGVEHVAFREFALSVNLNTEDFDGGRLIFPEFNSREYEIPTGAGLIFSASLIHEALPVTRGSRYVLLTFLHSDAAEARRLAYEERADAQQ